LPPVLRELRKRYADLHLEIQTGEAEALLAALERNEIELVLASGLARRVGLTAHSVFRDELMFVYSQVHPWADDRPLTSERLRGQSLILYSRTSPTALEVLRQLAIGSNPGGDAGRQHRTIKELVRLNLSVPFWRRGGESRTAARYAFCMRSLGRPPLRREWVLATLAGRRVAGRRRTSGCAGPARLASIIGTCPRDHTSRT
jgi:hypothetical protein